MSLTFVGSQYVNSKPLIPRGLKFLSTIKNLSEYSIIDIGNFSLKYSNNLNHKEELLNYFLVNYIKDKPEDFFTIGPYLIGEDAISLANLQKQIPLRLIKNNSLVAYQKENIDTHEILSQILQKLITSKKIIVSDQNSLIINFFKKNFNDIQIIDKTFLIHRKYKKDLQGPILTIDVGFNETNFLFEANNLFFERRELEYGVEFIHNLIQSSSDYKSYDLINKELKNLIDFNDSDKSFNCLYDFGLEQLFDKTVTQYLEVLKDTDLINLTKKNGLTIILSGSLFKNINIANKSKEILKELCKSTNINNIIVDNNKYIFIDSLYGN